MADIRTLLNPMSDKRQDRMAAPSTPTSSPTISELGAPRKKTKLTKDAPVFTPGPVRGDCRFPPDEYQDIELAAYHQQFEVTPFGEIADYPRHIPYNSEKKSFLEKTHREHLEVFQYTFKVPGDETIYTMLWDYNIGLVRTTPLFKCTGHSKTTPAKMLNRNPGLRDICHSITGGALVAQGYWIPHAAAKAIASTFCYDIRYALTPVFGHDFPRKCLKPDDEGFGDMTIDPAITKFCTQQAKTFRDEEESTTQPVSRTVKYPLTPNTPTPRRPKAGLAKKHKRLEQVYSSPYSTPYSSPYASDTGSEESCISAASTPEPAYRNVFTPINTSRQPPRSVPYPERRLPSPHEILPQSTSHCRYMPEPPMTPAPSITRSSSEEISPKTIPRKLIIDQIERDLQSKTQDGGHRKPYNMDWLDRQIPEEQQRAAYALLSLKFAKSGEEVARGLGITMPCQNEGGRRSRSA